MKEQKTYTFRIYSEDFPFKYCEAFTVSATNKTSALKKALKEYQKGYNTTSNAINQMTRIELIPFIDSTEDEVQTT